MKGGVQSADTSENDNDVIEIRLEERGDSAAIQEVHTKAFGGPLEAKLVRLISERKEGPHITRRRKRRQRGRSYPILPRHRRQLTCRI